MTKLTLQEYATKEKISLVTVNKRVNKGLINSEKIGNRRYILIDEEKIKIETNNINKPINDSFTKYLLIDNKQLVKQINKLNKQLLTKDKEIKRLTKELSKVTQTKENLYEKVLGYTIEHKPQEDIEVVTTNDKKKKKAKKKKDKK